MGLESDANIGPFQHLGAGRQTLHIPALHRIHNSARKGPMSMFHYLSAPAAPLLIAVALIATCDSALAQGDDCSAPTPIGGAGTFAFDNAPATTSGFTGGSCTANIQRDVFWRWTAPQSGDYQFDTFGTSFDTRMSVHAGPDCNATCVGSNDDAGQSPQSRVQVLGIQAGEQLLVQVGSFFTFAGPGQMNISQINDPCAGLAEDSFEPNDICSSPRQMGPGTYTNLFVSQTDPDFYGVVLQPGERLDASIVGQVAGDVDLRIYDSGCGLITSGGTSVGYTHVGSSARTLRVEAYLDTTTNQVPCALYDLNIQVALDPCLSQADDAFEDYDTCYTALPLADGTWTGFHVDRWDKDFFEFCVPAHSTVTIDALFPHSQGDVDMFLWADWAFPCGIGIAGITLAEGTSIDDNEVVSWTNNGNNSQRCYLELNIWQGSDSSCNDYDLVIQGADLCFLGSSFCGPAQDNSAGRPGKITARGSLRAADNNITLVASDLPDNIFGFFLVSRGQGLVMNPAGSWGHLCLGGSQPIGRLNGASSIGFSQGGRFEVPIDLTRIPEPPSTSAVQAGESWNFQAWHRDTVAGQAGSNFTDGLQITFQ